MYRTMGYLDAYDDWIVQMIEEGRNPFFVTFMFNPIGGSNETRSTTMAAAVEELYTKILTRTYRNPKSRKNAGKLPVLITAPDFPVFKYHKDHIAEIAVNDGLHMHGIWMMPEETRLEGDLSGEFLNYGYRYSGPGRVLSRIRADRITETPRTVGNYLLKSVRGGRVDPDKIMILPRTRSEITSS